MSVINFKRKEIIAKVVYYGPGLSGKTTNVQQIHALMPPDHRGDLTTLPTEQDRTLFFDYVPLNLGDIGGFKTRFQIFTVPGQVFYSSTRRVVLQGTDGVVFVADSSPDAMSRNLESLADLRQNLLTYDRYLNAIAFVIQYNKRDIAGALPVSQLERELNLLGVPSFEAVAAHGQGVLETLSRISSLVLTHLKTSIEGKLTRGRRDASMVERFDDHEQSDADLVKGLVGQIAEVRSEENVMREYLEGPASPPEPVSSVMEDAPTPITRPSPHAAPALDGASTLSIVDEEDTGSLSGRSADPPSPPLARLEGASVHSAGHLPMRADIADFELDRGVPEVVSPSARPVSSAPGPSPFGDSGEPHPAVPHSSNAMAASSGAPEFESSRGGGRGGIDRDAFRTTVFGERSSLGERVPPERPAQERQVERVQVEKVSIERAATEGGELTGTGVGSSGEGRSTEGPRPTLERSALTAFQPGDIPPWEPRATSSIRLSGVQSTGVVPASMAVMPAPPDEAPREPVSFAPATGKPVSVPAGPLEITEVGEIGRKGNTLFIPLILRDGTVQRPITLELTLSGREIPGGKPELPSWLHLWLIIISLVAGAALALSLAG